MAPKDRTDQVEQRSPLRLPNKISDASPVIASRLKLDIKAEIQKHRPNDVLPRFLCYMSTMTTLLPSHWEKLPVDMKMFLEKELFDPVLRHVLVTQELLNWCLPVKKVHPLITPGDGNCLLHAVSLAMWAVEDEDLMLRTALYQLLKEDANERNYMRWRRERLREDAAISGTGLMYDTMEWDREWEMVKEIARPDKRPAEAQGLLFESLEQFHVFMLANMLRRPIIIVAEDMMRSNLGFSLQPQNLQGIYLPLNWAPSECCRYPILLGFCQNHFCPLVLTSKEGDDSEDEDNEFVFPIVHQNLTPMKVHFLEEEEERDVQALLEKYLFVEEINHMGKSLSQTRGLPGARLVAKSGSPDKDLMTAYLALSETHYRSYLELEFGNTNEGIEPADKDEVKSLVKAKSPPYISPTQQLPKFSWSGSGAPVSQPKGSEVQSIANPPLNKSHSLVLQMCKTDGCIYYRSVSTGEYCHECFVKKQQHAQCQGAGCLNQAENGCQGLCRVCFDQRKLIRDADSKPSAPSLSKQSLDPAGVAAATSRPGDITPVSGPLPMSNRKRESPSSCPDDELNSMVVHQKLATKKCIMEECPLTGDPKLNDMCSSCYNESVEIEKGLKAKQLSQQASAAATGGNTGFSKAAAEPSKALHPVPLYTVKKNICATAGCDGIRLDGAAYSGYCNFCFKKNSNKSSPVNPEVYGAAGGSSDNRIYDNLPYNRGPSRDARPTAELVQSKGVKSRATVFGVSEPPKTTSQTTVSQNPFADLKANTTTAAPAGAKSAPKSKICAHPRCNNAAAPPKFMLCDQCIFIASMYQQQVEDEKPKPSSEQAGHSSSEKQQPEPAEPVNKPKEVMKQTSKFKNTRIIRTKCQAPGGCMDDMFGDPEFNNLCSRCFSKMMMKRSRTKQQPKAAPAVTHQEPIYCNTAPLKSSPRVSPPPPRAHTGYMGDRVGNQSPRRSPVPSNYQPCAYPGCNQQANIQILDGYCNDCHRVYRTQVMDNVLPAQGPDRKPIANKGRFAFPEGWVNVGGQVGYGMGTAGEPNTPFEENRVGEGPPQAEPNRTDMKCYVDGCTNYGNPRSQGFCNSCFRLMKN